MRRCWLIICCKGDEMIERYLLKIGIWKYEISIFHVVIIGNKVDVSFISFLEENK